MKNDEPIESKVERSRFARTCKCGKVIYGTSVVQLEHTFRLHQMFCKSNKKQKEVTKDETTDTTN